MTTWRHFRQNLQTFPPIDCLKRSPYSIVNGQVVPVDVNVDDVVDIGQTMAGSFRNTLPNVFHGKISNQVKTMEQLKRSIKVGGKTVFDLEAIFIRIVVIG